MTTKIKRSEHSFLVFVEGMSEPNDGDELK